MNTTNHTIGEDAANVASCELCKGVGQIGMPGQRCFACDGSGKSKFSALAANVAIGEREAYLARFGTENESLAFAMRAIAADAYDTGYATARAALPAEKVAGQEPVAGELQAFEEWFKTSGFWNNAITGKAWRAACAWMRESNATMCQEAAEKSRNSLFRSAAKICAGLIRSGRNAQCDLPPEGWYCTRDKGHEGPCAAYATEQQPAQPVAQTPALTDEQIHERVLLACHSDPVSFTGQYVLTLDEIRALLTVAQPASSLAEGGERE